MIKFSRNNYPSFSNFHIAPIVFQGVTYSSSEAAFQSMKTIDYEERLRFTQLSPSTAKKMGRKVQLRPDWEEIKYPIMVEICYAKFTQNTALKYLLLHTGDEEIIENTTAWHDNIWGNCECPKCVYIDGQNLLGKALMEVRARIRTEEKEKEMKNEN